jgi:trehalose synthase-fused probable maltokinase
MTADLPLLPGRATQVFADTELREKLEGEILPAFIPRCRWFGGKARGPQAFRVSEMIAVAPAEEAARLVLVEVSYASSAPETYLLPLQVADRQRAAALENEAPQALIARFADGGVLYDAVHDGAFRAALYTLIASTARSERGELRGITGEALPAGVPGSRVLAVEQSNSSIIYGETIFLKLYRRLEEGVNPDAEILRFLGARHFPHVPPFRGALEFQRPGGVSQVLALATGLVPNEGDAWSFTLEELRRQFAAILAGQASTSEEIETAYLARAAQLGRHTGALHRALAVATAEADFAAEPLVAHDFAELAATVRNTADEVFAGLRTRLATLDPATRETAAAVLAAGPELAARIASLAAQPVTATKIRTHGDYHLGQVLNTGEDFLIIDFEGEPAKPLAERRRKRSPLRDVAGMLRSFHYAAHSALGEFAPQRAQLEPAAERWHERARLAFLHAWTAETRGASFIPMNPTEELRLLDAFLLEKALYEVVYELNNRPTWLGIPLRGVAKVLGDPAKSPSA